MPAFSAAIFATRPRPMGDEHSFIAYALLFEGSRPHWELHVEEKVFRFIPDPTFIMEDGLAQIAAFTSGNAKQWSTDMQKSGAPLLWELLGEDHCKELRENLVEDLSALGLHCRIITWPGIAMLELAGKVEKWNKLGVEVEVMGLSN